MSDRIPTSVPRGIAISALIVATVAGFLGWRILARPAPIEDRMPMASGEPSGVETTPGSSDPSGAGRSSVSETGEVARSADDGSTGTGADVTLHVAGAVNRPGLVSVPEGSRVADAAAAAGGLGVTADLERVNLAATVVDGSRVFIPAVGQEIPPEVPVTPSADSDRAEPTAETPLDLNAADAGALEALPGVGPATAAAIVKHREDNGRFTTVESLLDVRGIGEAKLEAMRDLVTVR